MLKRRSFVARARRGTDLTQTQAAAKMGLSRATMCCYEADRVTPSRRRTWGLLRGLALGDPVPDERPVLLLSFALFGQRFASWRSGLLVFREIDHIERVADELDDCLLERIVIVPCWPSHIEKILQGLQRHDGSVQPIVFEEHQVEVETVIADVIAAISVAAPGWMADHLRAGVHAEAA